MAAPSRRLFTLRRLTSAVIGVACLLTCAARPALAQSDPASKPAPAPVSAKEVRLGYFANVTHAQAVLGVDSGDFAAAVAPAKFSTKSFNAGPSLIEALFAGEIDIAYVGPSPALNAHIQSRGKGIRVIAGAAGNGVVIVARPDSGIEKLEDLKGKRIATPQLGNTQDISARHYLVKTLGQANADSVVPIPNAEQAAMMSRKQIDAAWAVEPWGARLVAEAGGKIIAEEKDLWPDKTFTLTLVVVSPEFFAKHPDAVERILDVHCRWTERLAKDPAAHVHALAAALEKLTSKKLSTDIISAAIARVTFTDEPLANSLKTFAQWAFDLGLARSVPDVATLVDTSLLSKVRQARAAAPSTLAPVQPAPAAPKSPDRP